MGSCQYEYGGDGGDGAEGDRTYGEGTADTVGVEVDDPSRKEDRCAAGPDRECAGYIGGVDTEGKNEGNGGGPDDDEDWICCETDFLMNLPVTTSRSAGVPNERGSLGAVPKLFTYFSNLGLLMAFEIGPLRSGGGGPSGLAG